MTVPVRGFLECDHRRAAARALERRREMKTFVRRPSPFCRQQPVR